MQKQTLCQTSVYSAKAPSSFDGCLSLNDKLRRWLLRHIRKSHGVLCVKLNTEERATIANRSVRSTRICRGGTNPDVSGKRSRASVACKSNTNDRDDRETEEFNENPPLYSATLLQCGLARDAVRRIGSWKRSRNDREMIAKSTSLFSECLSRIRWFSVFLKRIHDPCGRLMRGQLESDNCEIKVFSREQSNCETRSRDMWSHCVDSLPNISPPKFALAISELM